MTSSINTFAPLIFGLFILFCVTSSCKKESAVDLSGGCPAIDMGLSVKWAAYNVGATEDSDSGLFFAWGEVTEKACYGWHNPRDYKWGMYKEEETPEFGMEKYTSFNKRLDLTDDAAAVIWGAKWRMPSKEEVSELLDRANCTWVWGKKKDSYGYFVTSLKTNNTIFLPATGLKDSKNLDNEFIHAGYYWSSSLDYTRPYCARSLVFDSDYSELGFMARYLGMQIRAVTNGR